MKGKVITITKDWWNEDRPAIEEVRTKLVIAKTPRTYPKGSKYYSPKEAGELLGVSDWTIRKYIKLGELEAEPKKKGWRINEVAIEEYRRRLWIKKMVG